ncbi:MAG TPA: UDP-3-O-(3-hydroxymyristoyl)glucosamine N-acyltransferase [Vicinamibacteria bacterium]|nr:UDP-3-O-(3-hydroxymyristoyl)glucosamine N-acyltransferase [Vicinamibacteria bacterium]
MSTNASFRLDALCARLHGELVGDGAIEITGLSSLADAGPGDLSLFADPRYRKELANTKASAIVARERIPHPPIAQVLVKDPLLALIDLVELFHQPTSFGSGVHALASVSPSTRLGEGVTVGPFAVIGEDVTIGARTVVHPGAYLGPSVSVGDDSLIWTNAVIRDGCRLGDRVIIHPGAVIGADGFGFARRDGKFHKIRHVGIVVIEDDVEIGANATIDRATLGQTRIERGVKIDNLVHIAHNVHIGEDSAMAAQVGISGSTVVGKRVLMGGQSGLVDHLTIGEDAVLIAQSGVIGDVPAGATVSGYPARHHREVLKSTAELRGLEKLRKRVRELEKEILALRQGR